MARIRRIGSRDAGVRVKLAYAFTRRGMAQMTGRSPEDGLEPLEVLANIPSLLMAVGKLEQATAKLDRLDPRLNVLAQLKAATMTSCEYCIDLGSQIARRSGLSDEQLLALPDHRSSPLFTPGEKLVLDYAAAASRTPVDVPDELFAALQEHLDDAQLLELAHLVALENYRGRLNLPLGIHAAGFSEGMVCATPVAQAG